MESCPVLKLGDLLIACGAGAETDLLSCFAEVRGRVTGLCSPGEEGALLRFGAGWDTDGSAELAGWGDSTRVPLPLGGWASGEFGAGFGATAGAVTPFGAALV